MCIDPKAGRTREPIVNTNDRPPFGESRAHLMVVRQPVTQTVEPLGDSLALEGREAFCSGVHFNAGDDTPLSEHISQRCSSRALLMDSLILENDATDEV